MSLTKGFPAADLSKVIGASVHGLTPSALIEHLLIDSRKLLFPASSLFFAIRSERNDGHNYVAALYKQGVRNFVVDRLPDLLVFSEASFFLAEDVVLALQLLATHHRNQFTYPVVGITGSNGKTIVKEWLNHLLQHAFDIVRSPRSWNSQLGVPLSVWQMQAHHNLAIVEAGISEAGEMQQLHAVVKPTLGIFTNIGDAHSEGFYSLDQKLQEKLQLFHGVELLVYCRDHAEVHGEVHELLHAGLIGFSLSWGADPGSDLVVSTDRSCTEGTMLQVKHRGEQYSLHLEHTDAVSIENALHCFALAVYLGKGHEVVEAMKELPPLAMRLEVKEGQWGATIINDSYSADLSGVLSALEFMSLQHPQKQRVVILSDITGIAGNDGLAYQKLVDHLQTNKVQQVFAVGPRFAHHAPKLQQAGIAASFFDTATSMLQQLNPTTLRDKVILVKGARRFRFESISQYLESKGHNTRLEIDRSALTDNLKQFRSRLGPSIHIMAMVKAFSYGAGSDVVAHLLQYNHIDFLAVAYVDEGIALRKAGVLVPIMIMNTEPSTFSALLEHNLEPEIYSTDIARALLDFLRAEGIAGFPVHIKLDTGMHRLGFDAASVRTFINMMASDDRFVVRSVFTHLVAAEAPAHDDFTRVQLRLFEDLCTELRNAVGHDFLVHAANTAAIARHPEARYDMVRLGIGLYGIDPAHSDLQLREAASLKTTIAQIRQVPAGDSVGYGRKWLLEKEATIATIRIGYADGFPRHAGNGRATVLIRGKQCKTIGQVCMDMTMIDITGHTDITVDDTVLVFGPEHSVLQLARSADTIAYEIMTGISQRVPRIYFGE